jgi:hypothetical protein
MQRTMMLAIAPAVLIGALNWNAPEPDGYTVLDREARPFATAFDEAEGKIRLVMYVSPTCGGCLLGAREMQQEVLEKIDSTALEIYVVRGPKNGAQANHVDRVTNLVDDSRATQYWDEHAAVAGPYDKLFDLAGPCAGVFALYGPDAKWDTANPPEPLVWQDAHADQRGREDNPPLDAEAMADRVRALLKL